MIKYFVVVLFIALGVLPAEGAGNSRYVCQGKGYIFDEEAVVSGQLEYSHGNALGDGDYSKFTGTIRARSGNMKLIYEGWVNVELKGYLRTRGRDIYISVLDDTGGKMIIYDGRATLYAPETLGEFYIRWERVR